MMRHVTYLAVLATLVTASAAHAVKFPLFTFEADEFGGDTEASNPLGGANSSAGLGGGFGVTEGTQAFVVRNSPASQNPIFLTTVSGSDTGESLSNNDAFRSAVSAMESGQSATFNFDYSYDFTNTTTGGFFQPGLIFNNSGGGYQSNLAYGGLAGGNVRSFADFPAIGPAAAAGGATLTVLDPINYVDDFKGTLRMSIPVGLPGSGKPIIIGNNAVPNNSYFQFAFNTNGGFGGTADYAFDNFYFNAVSPTAPGDFNADGAVNALDIDLLFAQPNGAVSPSTAIYDVNNDGQINHSVNVTGSDSDYFIRTLASTQYGDANFDKKVEFLDLVALAQNYNKPTGATWSIGSFNGDGAVNFDDLVLLAQNYNFGTSLTGDFAADWALAQSLAPEPTSLLALGAASLILRRSRRHA